MHSSDFFELIRSADLGAVQAALAEDPQLATAKAESQRVPNGESERWTPLHAAIEARSLGIVRALVVPARITRRAPSGSVRAARPSTTRSS